MGYVYNFSFNIFFPLSTCFNVIVKCRPLCDVRLLPLGRPSSDPDPASGPAFYLQFNIIRSYKYLCLSTKCFPLWNNHIYMTKRTISSPLVDT